MLAWASAPVAGQHLQHEDPSSRPAAVEPDLDQVRVDLRLAIERARLHLEWVEIALALTQWRFEESTRRTEPEVQRIELPERHTLSLLVVQPRTPELPAPAASVDGAIEVTSEAR